MGGRRGFRKFGRLGIGRVVGCLGMVVEGALGRWREGVAVEEVVSAFSGVVRMLFGFWTGSWQVEERCSGYK